MRGYSFVFENLICTITLQSGMLPSYESMEIPDAITTPLGFRPLRTTRC
jgi:hypothetical protein